MAVAPKLETRGMMACRMVVMPEWQGAGVGMRFLNDVCRLQFTDANKFHDRTDRVYFHTSHPGLCAALRRDKKWIQVSQMMGGASKADQKRRLASGKTPSIPSAGGHHRAVQGFKMTREKAGL
jgi:GNAT superfamily N-acetyltransferase